METIKNYLENMFSHLPNTPEVQKAKYELYQMMEDKYNELISEGKSDNEAIGIALPRDCCHIPKGCSKTGISQSIWSAALHNRKSWTDIQRMHSAFTRFTGRI